MKPESETQKLPGNMIQGGVVFNIDVRLSEEELAKWSPEKVACFFEGVAKIMQARRDAAPEERNPDEPK